MKTVSSVGGEGGAHSKKKKTLHVSFVFTPQQNKNRSADLWIFSSYNECTTCDYCDEWLSCCTLGNSNPFRRSLLEDSKCCFFKDIMNDYDHNLSVTYKRFSPEESWSIEYGKGSATGYLSQDSVTVGGLTVNSQVTNFPCFVCVWRVPPSTPRLSPSARDQWHTLLKMLHFFLSLFLALQF